MSSTPLLRNIFPKRKKRKLNDSFENEKLEILNDNNSEDETRRVGYVAQQKADNESKPVIPSTYDVVQETNRHKDNPFQIDSVEDVFFNVLQYFVADSGFVDVESIRNIMCVSRRWYHMSSSSRLWKKSINSNCFGLNKQNISGGNMELNCKNKNSKRPFQRVQEMQNLNKKTYGSFYRNLSLDHRLIGFAKLQMISQNLDCSTFKVKDRATGKQLLVKISRHEGPYTSPDRFQASLPNDLLKEIVVLDRISGKGIKQDVPLEISNEYVYSEGLSLLRGLDICNGYLIRWYDYAEFSLHEYINKNRGNTFESERNIRRTKIKNILYQIISGVDALHKRGLTHRNLSPLAIYLCDDHDNKRSKFSLVKIAKFSSVRSSFEMEGEKYFSKSNRKQNSYQAPEILMEVSACATTADIWSVGCIFAEMISGKVLFPFKNSQEQLAQIWRVLSESNIDCSSSSGQVSSFDINGVLVTDENGLESMFQSLDAEGLDLLKKLLCLDPEKRINSTAALQHPYFRDIDRIICVENASKEGVVISTGSKDKLKTKPNGSERNSVNFDLVDLSVDTNRYHLKSSQWAAIVDWVFEVISVFEKNTRTAFLTMAYFDRFLSNSKVKGKKLQLIAATCLHIASKIEDDDFVSVDDLVFCADKTFARNDIIALEGIILKKIKWQISNPLIYDFVIIYLGYPTSRDEKNQCFWLAMYIAELALQSSVYVKFDSSLIAAAVIALARYSAGERYAWTKSLEEISGFHWEDLSDALKYLSSSIDKRFALPKLKIIGRRYSNENKKFVSSIAIKSVRSKSDLAAMNP